MVADGNRDHRIEAGLGGSPDVCSVLYRLASGLLKDLPAAGDRPKEAALGQLFMRPDHQIAALVQRSPKAIQNRMLQLDLKIGENDVAAENEIEPAGRKLRPDILAFEGDPVPMDRAHAVVRTTPLKRSIKPVSRDILHAAEGEAGSLGSPQHHLVPIRADHLNSGCSGLRLDFRGVEDLERIRFLTGCTASTPTPDRAGVQDGGLGELWQDHSTQDIEHALVAIQARDGDIAEIVDYGPLVRGCLEPTSILLECLQPQLIHPAPKSLAYLGADLAEPRPAQSQLRQGPLQKGRTLVLAHGRLIIRSRAQLHSSPKSSLE